MRKIVLLTLLLVTTLSVSAQFGGQRQNSRLGRQVPNTPPNESQKADMERKQAERQEEYVSNFLTTLEADAFQKEIAKQTLNDYFEKTKSFLKLPFANSVERKDAFEAFKIHHFAELKTMLPENDIKKLDTFLEGKFEEKEVVKKKKKKKRRKKNKDDDN